MNLLRIGHVRALALFLLCCSTATHKAIAIEQDNIRNSLAGLARATTEFLKSEGLDSIAIGQFTGPPSFGSSAGPGIRQVLKEEFSKIGIREKKINAAVGIQGKYLLADTIDVGTNTPIPDQQQLKIEVDLVDRNGAVLTNLNVKITYHPTDQQDFTKDVTVQGGKMAVNTFSQAHETGMLLGATADLTSPKKDSRGFPSETKTVLESFARPTATIFEGNAVASSPTSPYRVQVLVNGTPKPIVLEDGHPFVELKRDDVFAIQIQNYSDFQVGAKILLDGVSIFAFSENRHLVGPKRGQPAFERYLFEAKQQYALNGWHINNQSVDQFRVTDFANSAAAKFGSNNNLGTISATFQAAWKKGTPAPPGEPQQFASHSDIGIGRGDRVNQQSQAVQDPMEYGIVRSIITIRYVRPQ